MKYFMILTISFILAQAHASDFNRDKNPYVPSAGPNLADYKAIDPIVFQNSTIPKIANADITKRDANKRVMGHYAAQAGYDLLLSAILKKARDQDQLQQLIDVQDSDGDTMLHKAVISGKMEVVELLLTYDAKTSVENKFNLTPSLLAGKLNLTDIEQRIKTAETKEMKKLVGEIMEDMERIDIND